MMSYRIGSYVTSLSCDIGSDPIDPMSCDNRPVGSDPILHDIGSDSSKAERGGSPPSPSCSLPAGGSPPRSSSSSRRTTSPLVPRSEPGRRRPPRERRRAGRSRPPAAGYARLFYLILDCQHSCAAPLEGAAPVARRWRALDAPIFKFGARGTTARPQTGAAVPRCAKRAANSFTTTLVSSQLGACSPSKKMGAPISKHFKI